MDQKAIRNVGKLIVLYLLPGLIILFFYYLFTKIGFLENYPRLIVLAIAAFPGIVGFELGYLFYVAYKEEKTWKIWKVLGLKSP